MAIPGDGTFGNPNYDDTLETPDYAEETKTHKKSIMMRSCWGWTPYHITVAILTFFVYAFFHIARKSFSNVKPLMEQDWMPQNLSQPITFNQKVWNEHAFYTNLDDSVQFLGTLDACFLFAYAVGLYANGYLGDRFDPRIVISVGMWLSAVVVILFGYVTEVAQFYSKPFYVCMWIANGLVQASGWPNVLCVMGNWFGKGSRGAILGLWSANASVGNIIGAYLSSYFLQYGYEYTFLVAGSILFAGGIVVWFSLVSAPRDVGLPDPNEMHSKEVASKNDTERPKAIAFYKAILLPGVLFSSLAYACLKFVNYSFFFWLPYYLNNAFNIETSLADQLSTWYDWGGIVGGFIAGVISDRLGYRTIVIVIMLFCAIAAVGGYAFVSAATAAQIAVMTTAGFFIGGPANLLSTVLCADLGRNPSLNGNVEAIASVAGIMDGTGSFGAGIGQLLVPVMDTHFGWKSVFILFIVMCILTIMWLSRITYNETKELIQKFRNRSDEHKITNINY